MRVRVTPPAEDRAAQRIDKWLWCARFAKTRTLAGKLADAGGVRLTRNGATVRIAKASALVRPGDRLAFALGDRLMIVEIAACGDRRGPSEEARRLYSDLTPPEEKRAPGPGERGRGAGRPTKRDRRAVDRLNEAR